MKGVNLISAIRHHNICHRKPAIISSQNEFKLKTNQGAEGIRVERSYRSEELPFGTVLYADSTNQILAATKTKREWAMSSPCQNILLSFAKMHFRLSRLDQYSSRSRPRTL